MTISDAEQVYPERRTLVSRDRLQELEQMLDQGDACLRGLPYREEFTHLLQTKCGTVYLVKAGK